MRFMRTENMEMFRVLSEHYGAYGGDCGGGTENGK